jgi:hypothetical protein
LVRWAKARVLGEGWNFFFLTRREWKWNGGNEEVERRR